MKNEFPILNYPGSKRKLLNFIDSHISEYLPNNKAVFDIFAGTGAVSYYYKENYKVFANDSEKYSSVILDALLKFQPESSMDYILDQLRYYYEENFGKLNRIFEDWIDQEEKYINNLKFEDIENLYFQFPNVWKENINSKNEVLTISKLRLLPYYCLFTTYYSGTYFGIKQSIEIDSLRFAIEKINLNNHTKNMLLASLFYAMKESVFSKDGHMAQPLNLNSNITKLCKRRSVSIYSKFIFKVSDFYSVNFVKKDNGNKVFNTPITDIKKNLQIFDNVGFIYADPPYTDMQYSRYFHLLNTLVNYNYPEFSLYRGQLSKGLYTDDRYQSPLSQKSKALNYHKNLFEFCHSERIGIAFSFAYPFDPLKQPTNRYVFNIFDLIDHGKKTFGKNFRYFTKDYNHSNNRNSQSKRVLEYLLLYTP